MSIISKIVFLFLFVNLNAFAQKIVLTNPVGKKIPEATLISLNRSIMSCGERTGLSVYSSIEIQAVLSISNMLTSEKTPLETNWDIFSPTINSNSTGSLNEKEFLNYPPDVQRIIFLCLTWDESFRLKLFNISNDALDDITNSVMKKKPWSVLPKKVSERIDTFSQLTIKDFVYLVLRANTFYTVRGGFNKNPTLWATSFSWRVPVTTNIQPKEKNDVEPKENDN